jgi:lipopolysaccharide transport system ATP-binding protein
MPVEIPEPFRATVPEGTIIGVVGIKGSGKGGLLRSIVEHIPGSRLTSLGDFLNLAHAPVIALDAALACQDALTKARTAVSIEQARRHGSIIFLVSHDELLLLRLADEIWWLNDGRLAGKGDPREVLAAYRGFVAARLAEWGRTLPQPVEVSTRRGDLRAEVVSVETLDFAGAPTGVLKSGEPAAIRVALKFHESVEAPVAGIMIRTRIGFEVYGTNTELEGVALRPRAAGDSLRLEFRFRCELCPGDYTVTVACHTPDGAAHDWLDDAIAFSVADSRYTAGVANLHAQVFVL